MEIDTDCIVLSDALAALLQQFIEGGGGDPMPSADMVTALLPDGVDDPNDPAGDGSAAALPNTGPLAACDEEGSLAGVWFHNGTTWVYKPIACCADEVTPISKKSSLPADGSTITTDDAISITVNAQAANPDQGFYVNDASNVAVDGAWIESLDVDGCYTYTFEAALTMPDGAYSYGINPELEDADGNQTDSAGQCGVFTISTVVTCEPVCIEATGAGATITDFTATSTPKEAALTLLGSGQIGTHIGGGPVVDGLLGSYPTFTIPSPPATAGGLVFLSIVHGNANSTGVNPSAVANLTGSSLSSPVFVGNAGGGERPNETIPVAMQTVYAFDALTAAGGDNIEITLSANANGDDGVVHYMWLEDPGCETSALDIGNVQILDVAGSGTPGVPSTSNTIDTVTSAYAFFGARHVNGEDNDGATDDPTTAWFDLSNEGSGGTEVAQYTTFDSNVDCQAGQAAATISDSAGAWSFDFTPNNEFGVSNGWGLAVPVTAVNGEFVQTLPGEAIDITNACSEEKAVTLTMQGTVTADLPSGATLTATPIFNGTAGTPITLSGTNSQNVSLTDTIALAAGQTYSTGNFTWQIEVSDGAAGDTVTVSDWDIKGAYT